MPVCTGKPIGSTECNANPTFLPAAGRVKENEKQNKKTPEKQYNCQAKKLESFTCKKKNKIFLDSCLRKE